jgi:hypothetical protein
MVNARAGGQTAKPCDPRSIILIAALCVSSLLGLPPAVAAQAISTGAIRGAVRTEDGAGADGAHVRVLNTATGVTSNTDVAQGRFALYGLDVGGPYVVEVRRLGFLPQRSRPLSLTLGQALDIEFVLQRAAVQLDPVAAHSTESGASVHTNGGTATILPDSLLYRLPTMNRNFLDFVSLTPQISTKVGFQRGGMSGAGANLRFNNYLINGADEHFVSSNVSPAHNGGKSIPLDAVREYQVLLAPYDVRYGAFAGALVNTVTQTGTNTLRGSAFGYWRNNRLARGGDLAPDSLPYEQWEYGVSLGGPIVRDRVHFFAATEFRQLTSPAPGPYLGQPPNASSPAPVSRADVGRFATIMRDRYGLTAGSGGPVELQRPLRNLFVRLDAAIPTWNTRAIGFVSDSHSEDSDLSRSAGEFYLSSSAQTVVTEVRLASLQLHTDLSGRSGGHNELLISRSIDEAGQRPAVRQPLVGVVVPGAGGNGVALYAGAPESAQGGLRLGQSIRFKDELTLPGGAHHTTCSAPRQSDAVSGPRVWLERTAPGSFPASTRWSAGSPSGSRCEKIWAARAPCCAEASMPPMSVTSGMPPSGCPFR